MNVGFEHQTVDALPWGSENDVLLVADVDGDGNDDVIVAGKHGCPRYEEGSEGIVCWYQYPDWARHEIGRARAEAGGVCCDLTGNGLPDIVIGECGNGNSLYWWENPGEQAATTTWTRRVITKRFERYHDQACGDINGDGKSELIVLSQNKRMLVYFTIPDDPRVEPWPDCHCHVIDDDVVTEGLVVADVDGDGKNELVAGNFLYRLEDDGTWSRRELIKPHKWARAAVGDLNGSGHLVIVLSEAETSDARLLWLEGPEFTVVHDLGSDYEHLHTLELGDFTGDGSLDIFTGEMHLGLHDDPAMFVFINDGNGAFRKTRIECPNGTHEGRLIHLGDDPLPSILGKPYSPHSCLELWENTNNEKGRKP